MDGLDLVEVALAIYGLGSLVIAIAVIAWPIKSDGRELRRIIRARWPR